MSSIAGQDALDLGCFTMVKGQVCLAKKAMGGIDYERPEVLEHGVRLKNFSCECCSVPHSSRECKKTGSESRCSDSL
ncbi:hypothetical protein VNO80_05206 [Phaseolus coccineus]|uniref:Uncharacterized protein n=1 Tax=Phaseolus coccineus TaxID=3886 RepID=A0AAN9RDH1_PHACN